MEIPVHFENCTAHKDDANIHICCTAHNNDDVNIHLPNDVKLGQIEFIWKQPLL